MKWIKRLMYFILFVYAVLCAALFFFQEKIIFQPDKLPENHVFRAGEEVEIEVDKGISLNCLWLKERPSKGVILYLHGNRGSNRRCLYQAQNMDGHGYDIFMPDYRGFGKSEGQVKNDRQLYRDVQKVYDFLKEKYPEHKIVVVGYSLGTGMASYLAAHNNPQQLVLLAPYVSMLDMKDRHAPLVPDFLLKFKLRNDKHLAIVECPVTLFHGTADRVIPFVSSEILKEVKSEAIELVTLRNEGHRGTIFNNLFRRKIGEMLR
ncbi:MAG: alpha/beta fold hydrolase [Bacteroidota bacterium]